MHARNRSPGNGYRTHAMGMGGVAPASRISPESSMRGHGGYNSEYRSYNRGGFGRGQVRQFNRSQAPPLPRQKGGDVFVEAGKLAAEYLIAKGLLPSNVLSGKWQNGSLKNLIGAQEGDGVPHSLDGRASALSRLGEAGADSGPGRRRYTDDYSNNSMWSRNSLRGRKRIGSLKNYGSDWNREVGRSGSWSERSRVSTEGDDDSDVLSRHRDEQYVGNDSDRVSQSSTSELAPASDVVSAQESEIAGGPHSSSEKLKSGSNAGAKNSASSSKKDSDKEAMEKDGSKVSNVEGDKNKDAGKHDEMEVQDTKDDKTIIAYSDEGSLASVNSPDLLKLCRFAKFPTRTRSSVAFRGSRVDIDPIIVNENTREDEPSKESVARVEDLTACNLSGDGLPYQMGESKAFDLDRVPAAENESGPSYPPAQGSSITPPSLPDSGSVLNDPELPNFGRINTMIMEHGEKRGLDEGNSSMANKKPRISATSEDVESDGCIGLSDSPGKRPIVEELMTSDGQTTTSPSDEKRLLDITSYPKSNVEPCMEYMEEKQLLPGSFKTCDLNLMEASEANDNQDTGPILLFPPVSENGRQPISVDIDLSIHNNPRVSNRYGKCSVGGKDIEVIDLENDSMQDDRDLADADARTENVFTGLGGFASSAPNANEIPDSSDGYGLMISELMGNDIPNCSSVPAGVDSLHNDMGLDNGEGILGDDDPIYMSLGEIPFSFLRVWEQQPTQEYGKPF